MAIEPDDASFRRLVRALNEEAHGTAWQSDAADELEDALQPGVSAVRGAIMGMATGGLPHAGESLRVAVAGAVEPVVRFAGPRPGARIRAKTITLRGFTQAPRRLNARSWRHPIHGSDVWVTQIGAPGWFDETLKVTHPRLAAGARKALERRAERISRKAPL